MSRQIILGLLIAVILSGCVDGGGSSTNSGSGATMVAADIGTASTQILMQGVPPSSVAVGENYSFRPRVSSPKDVVSSRKDVVSSRKDVVTFTIEGQPAWTTFDTSTGTLSGTPVTDDVGLSGDITIIANNGVNIGIFGPFTIRVTAETRPPTMSEPPVIGGTPATAVTAGQSYSFRPQSSDAAGKALTFAISNRPIWATFSTATGELSGTPSPAQVGTYSDITILVSDGTTSAALSTFAIVVTPSAPDMPVISGKPATSVVTGQTYSFRPTATDPASKSLTFSIAHMPSWATFSTATGQISGTPTVAQIGTDSNIIISASNGTSSASLAAFTITVEAPVAPDAPVISGTPVTHVTAGQAYGFQPTATDPAGRALTFSMVNRPAWASFNTKTGQLSGTPTTTEVGSYPGVGISVSNGTLSAALAQFSIIVSKPAAPASPTISGTPRTSVVGGNVYSFIPTTTDPSGAALSFSVKNAPGWATFNSATGDLSGTPTAADVGTYSNITIGVSDGTTSVSLPAFQIAVTQIANGSATLTWVPPTQNTNGTPLTNLAGYQIYYGTSATVMSQSVKIANPGIVTYVVSNLSPGTWYFSVRDYTSANVESGTSTVVSTTID
jgi:Putative Ig domain